MIKGYKGFDKDLKCRGYQYEVGGVHETDEKPVRCTDNGFHFCENPLDVFGYYSPADSRYCEVEGDGDIDKDNQDSKVAASRLRIGLEIGLKGLIEAGVKFILEKVDWENAKESNTGNYSAATNTGDQSAASVEGKESIAMATGYQGKAKGALGCWIVLAEWVEDDNSEYHIINVKTTKVDGEIIKVDTYYRLSDGEFVEDEEE